MSTKKYVMNFGQKLVYATFVALLISAIVVSHPIRVDAANAVTGEPAPESADTGSRVLKVLVQLFDEVLILTN